MLRNNIFASTFCFLILVGGCAGKKPPAPNAKVLELRRALYVYMIGTGHEPVDTNMLQNNARILALLKDIDPLDSPQKINVALDVFEYYDATDNLASSYAREMLVRDSRWTLPFVRARIKSALNPADMRSLINEIESR